jgi:hypothetical protein
MTCALFAACAPPATFRDSALCLAPAPEGTPAGPSIAALVDRAEVIVLATVTRAGPTKLPGNYDDQGAQRVTLQVVETAKGAAPAGFEIIDGPCPMLMAKAGESLVVLLDATPGSAGLKPIGLPSSALRGTAARPLAALMNEIRAVRPLDSDAKALFERNRWTVTGTERLAEFVLPTLTEFSLAGRQIGAAAPAISGVEPFERYATLSAELGLDLRGSAGKAAELLTFWLERPPPDYAAGTPFGHVLISDRRIVGAWVTVFSTMEPFSVRDRAGALAATPQTGRWSPPPNRAPAGINIARAYDLGNARSLAFKDGAGRNGEITDPARLRALVDALDLTLATTQAVFDASTPPTRTYLHFAFDSRHLSLEYDSGSGLLTVIADGFSVKAPAAFVALVGTLR